MQDISIINTTIKNISKYGVCGYKNSKKEGFPEKLAWLKTQFEQGLIIKTLWSENDGTQGMIEYIPGKYCWRPVEATNYMFIHCIFVGFKKIYQKKGYASLLLKECENDAKKQKLDGLAVVTRKGSFMAGKELFIKKGFEIIDSAKPDFQLLVKKNNKHCPVPKFIDNKRELEKYSKGLTIIRASQCPYTVKNVREICTVAEKEYKLKVKVIHLKNHNEAQASPCPFGTFCMIYNGKVVAYHPISKARFVNIMKKINT